jgi:hypothetical protein
MPESEEGCWEVEGRLAMARAEAPKTEPTVESLMEEWRAHYPANYCGAPGDRMNCNRPLSHPRDFHAFFQAPALGEPVVLLGTWPA